MTELSELIKTKKLTQPEYIDYMHLIIKNIESLESNLNCIHRLCARHHHKLEDINLILLENKTRALEMIILEINYFVKFLRHSKYNFYKETYNDRKK